MGHEHSLRGLQVRPAMTTVRLEVTALGPLVPGVDKDHPLVRWLTFHLRHRKLQPILIGLRCRIVQNDGPVTGTRRVIPAWTHGVVAPVGDGVRIGEDRPGLRVVVHAQAFLRAGWDLCTRSKENCELRLKQELGIESCGGRIPASVPTGLTRDQVEAFLETCSQHFRSPRVRCSSRVRKLPPLIDEEHRLAVDANRARICEGGK